MLCACVIYLQEKLFPFYITICALNFTILLLLQTKRIYCHNNIVLTYFDYNLCISLIHTTTINLNKNVFSLLLYHTQHTMIQNKKKIKIEKTWE